MNFLTPEDYEFFDRCVEKWRDKLGLVDWRIERSTKPARGCLAEVKWDVEQRSVSYRVNPKWRVRAVTPELIEKTALHEMLHVRLHDLITLASENSDVNSEAVRNAEHAIINVFESLLVGAEIKDSQEE